MSQWATLICLGSMQSAQLYYGKLMTWDCIYASFSLVLY